MIYFFSVTLFTQVIKYVQDRKIRDVVHIIYIMCTLQSKQTQDRIDLLMWGWFFTFFLGAFPLFFSRFKFELIAVIKNDEGNIMLLLWFYLGVICKDYCLVLGVIRISIQGFKISWKSYHELYEWRTDVRSQNLYVSSPRGKKPKK